MAHQLGGERLYKLVAKNDQTRTAPGSTLLGQMLQQAGPCLILLDEILVYLLNAGSVQVGESTLKGITLTFLQQLTIAVANCPHAILIATLTSQITEYMGEKAEHEYALMEKVLGRVEKIRQAVQGTEIYEERRATHLRHQR